MKQGLSTRLRSTSSGGHTSAPGRWRWRALSPSLLGTASLLFSAYYVQTGNADPNRAQAALPMPPAVQSFLRQNCFACHNKAAASGGLNLAATAFRPHDAANHGFWDKLYDRASNGEMPPKAAPQPAQSARKTFLAALNRPLTAVEDA